MLFIATSSDLEPLRAFFTKREITINHSPALKPSNHSRQTERMVKSDRVAAPAAFTTSQTDSGLTEALSQLFAFAVERVVAGEFEIAGFDFVAGPERGVFWEAVVDEAITVLVVESTDATVGHQHVADATVMC